MAATNPNNLIPATRSNPKPPSNRLDERIRHYFDQHPEVSREEFLRHAVQRELHLREQRETDPGTGAVRRGRPGMTRWPTSRAPLTAEDIRIHVWLTQRLAVLHRERHGLWPRLRRFLFGSGLARWLGLQPRRTEAQRKRWQTFLQ